MYHIRNFEETDYESIVVIHNAVWPENPVTVDLFRWFDSVNDPQYAFQRTIVEKDGQVVAHGIYREPSWTYRPGKWYITAEVHPDCQRQGIGRFWYQQVMDTLKPHDPALIITETRENQLGAIAFLEKLGFRQEMRNPVSLLDVQAFDPSQFADAAERMRQHGIEARPLTELMESDPNHRRKLWKLEWDITQDVPFPDQLTQTPFEQWEKHMFGSPGFLPEAAYIALDGDEYVGMTMLWKDAALADKLHTGLTGVCRDYRRKGIATTIKTLSLTYAKDEYGATLIETDNEENNPMYDINVQLGFRPAPAFLFYGKQLRPFGAEA